MGFYLQLLEWGNRIICFIIMELRAIIIRLISLNILRVSCLFKTKGMVIWHLWIHFVKDNENGLQFLNQCQVGLRDPWAQRENILGPREEKMETPWGWIIQRSVRFILHIHLATCVKTSQYYDSRVILWISEGMLRV